MPGSVGATIHANDWRNIAITLVDPDGEWRERERNQAAIPNRPHEPMVMSQVFRHTSVMHAPHAHATFRKVRCKRSKTPTSKAIPAIQTASVAFTTQAGAVPTRRSRKGRKFQVVR